MNPVLAAKLLTLLTLAEVWLKMRANDDLGRAHKDMRELLNCARDTLETEFVALLRVAEIWRQKPNIASSSRVHEEVARCHADMRALLEGVTANG